jgi:hypothetical protein
MNEPGFATFDVSNHPATAPAGSRPDASNLQDTLIDDQDSVGTFDPNAPAAIPALGGSQLSFSPVPRPTLSLRLASSHPARIQQPPWSEARGSSRSLLTGSVTKSIFSKFSEIEGSLAKVNKIDAMMNMITLKLGLVDNPSPTSEPRKA